MVSKTDWNESLHTQQLLLLLLLAPPFQLAVAEVARLVCFFYRLMVASLSLRRAGRRHTSVSLASSVVTRIYGQQCSSFKYPRDLASESEQSSNQASDRKSIVVSERERELSLSTLAAHHFNGNSHSCFAPGLLLQALSF